MKKSRKYLTLRCSSSSSMWNIYAVHKDLWIVFAVFRLNTEYCFSIFIILTLVVAFSTTLSEKSLHFPKKRCPGLLILHFVFLLTFFQGFLLGLSVIGLMKMFGKTWRMFIQPFLRCDKDSARKHSETSIATIDVKNLDQNYFDKCNGWCDKISGSKWWFDLCVRLNIICKIK